MKLGFVDAILARRTLEEVLEFASINGFKYVETCCWPSRSQEEIDRLLASADGLQESLINIFLGITHIDVKNLSAEEIEHIKACQAKWGVQISSLCYYGNPLKAGDDAAKAQTTHFRAMIDAASALDINLITTFIGRDQTRNIEESIPVAVEFWTPIIRYAEAKGVRIAIENCPMYFNADQWPGGQNLFISPWVWRKMFEAIPSDNFGLCYDPSHMIFQHMDYIQPIYDFAPKIFHVHFKDAKVHKDRLNELGIMAYPLQYTSQKIPGHGDINWSQFISALNDIGYSGFGSIEIEDSAFEANDEDVTKALVLSKRYLSQFLI